MTTSKNHSLQDELWNKLQQDLLKDFPENYSSNVQLIKDILTFKHIVHPTAVVSSYFTIICGLTAESFYTEYNSSTTLYTISIAGTGTGKDMAVDLIPQIFSNIKNTVYETKTDIGYELVTSKITSVGALDGIFKRKRMLIYVLDEFGDALGKMQGGGHAGELTAKFKELYSQTNKTYKSIVYSRSNKNSLDNISRDYPCFILTGLTTKEQLLTRLKRSMLHDGFLNRFIIMDGSDLHPYINNDFEHTANNQFLDAIDFYCKVKNYPNTPIKMSSEAKEYYKSIGSPYEDGTDINKFCKENTDEEFETSASIANRWRENALRLATAITTYEYGVNNQVSDILDFQMKSFEDRKKLLKGTPLEKFNGAEDFVSESIREVQENAKKDPHSYPKIVQRITEGFEKHREVYNQMFNKAKVEGRKYYIASIVKHLLGEGLEHIINSSIETAKEDMLQEALDEIFKKTDASKKNLQIKYILHKKSSLAKNRIASLLRKKKFIYKPIDSFRVPLIPINTTFGKIQKLIGPFLAILNSRFTPPIHVEKDILEWAYKFVKEQSIKFYEIFHTEVGQSQHTIKKNKLITWLKENYDEENSWHTQSELAKTYVFNKLCTSKERELILKDLLDSNTIETKSEGSEGTFKPTKYYRLVNF